MRKPTTLRWIEEREAREVLAAARYDAPAPPFVSRGRWAKRLRRWVAAAQAAERAEAGLLPRSGGVRVWMGEPRLSEEFAPHELPERVDAVEK